MMGCAKNARNATVTPKKNLQELPLYMEHKNVLQSLQIALKSHKNNKQPISHNISIHSTWKNGERKKKQSCSKLGFRERYLGESMKIMVKLPINHANQAFGSRRVM